MTDEIARPSPPSKRKLADEEQRIRALFPLRLPAEVMARIEYLSTMNCIREVRKALHTDLVERRHFLTMVDFPFLSGIEYMHAYRIPGLISGASSDIWDSSEEGTDTEGDEDPDQPGLLEGLLHIEGWQDIGGNLE